jgi:hypothetical protein
MHAGKPFLRVKFLSTGGCMEVPEASVQSEMLAYTTDTEISAFHTYHQQDDSARGQWRTSVPGQGFLLYKRRCCNKRSILGMSDFLHVESAPRYVGFRQQTTLHRSQRADPYFEP